MLPDQALELVALERALLSTEELLRLRATRDEAARRGAQVGFGAQLVELGRATPSDLNGLLAEAQARARDCPHCRRPVLIPQGPPWPCPACRMPLVGDASGRFLAQPGGIVPSNAGSSARLPNPAMYAGGASGRFPAQLPPGSSGRLPAVGVALGSQPGTGRFPAMNPASRAGGGSSKFVRPVGQPIPSTAPGEGGAPAEEGAWGEGRRIGRYELVEELGRGAMGVVYRVQAVDQPEADLALKLLLGGDMASPTRRKRFEDEVRVMMRLDHPNLVKVRDWGLADGLHPFYVMDYVPGRDLRQVIKEGPLQVRDAVRVVMHVARAVEHVHAQGVIHRDLKPDNVRVNELDLAPTLFDFGLAKDLEQESGLTRSGVALGTPHYMAPEQAEGRVRDVGARTDVWSLGVILYELISGQVPFAGKSMNELVKKIARDEPTPLRKLRAETPRAVEEVVRRALRKEVGERWGSAGAFANALDDALAGRAQTGAVQGAVAAAAGIILLGGLGALLVTTGIVGGGAGQVTPKVDPEPGPPRPEAPLVPPAEVTARIAQARSTIDRARASESLDAQRAALTEAEGVLSALLSGGELAEVRHLRGLVLRDLDRWDDARADLAAAARAPQLAARALLARGLIDLRWSGQRVDAEIAWRQATPAANAAPAERAAGALAVALRTGLDGDLAAARRGVEAVLSERPEPEVATEALCALSWILTAQVQRGADATAALGTLLAQERLFRAPRFRYDYALDRAVLLALAGRLEEADRAREELLRLTRDGLGAELVLAQLLRRRSKHSEALDALQRIKDRATLRGVDRADVETLLRIVEAESRSLPPKPPTPPKPPGAVEEIQQLEHPATILPDTTTYAMELSLKGEVHCVWVALRGPEESDVDLYASWSGPVTDTAKAPLRCDGWTPDEDLVLQRGDAARPVSGETLQVLFKRASPAVEAIPLTIVIRLYPAGQKPWIWADGPQFAVAPARAERLERARAAWVKGEVDAALLGLGELTREEPALALLRSSWLGELRRWQEAEAALEPMLKQAALDPRLITWRARCWRELGKPERGIAPLEALIAAKKELLRPRLELAECLLATKRLDDALAVADAVLALDRFETRAMALQAIARSRRGDPEGPSRLVIIAAAPDAAPAASLRAFEELMARGDPAALMAAVGNAVKVWPKLSGTQAVIMAEACFRAGKQAECDSLLGQLEKIPVHPGSRVRLSQLRERLAEKR